MSSADELFCNGQIKPMQPLQDEPSSSADYGTSFAHSKRSANYSHSLPSKPYNTVAAWEELNRRSARPKPCDETGERNKSREGRQRSPESGKQRRARSLSPTRVFHSDDQQAGASWKDNNYLSAELSSDVKDKGRKQGWILWKQTMEWALKECLGLRGEGKANSKPRMGGTIKEEQQQKVGLRSTKSALSPHELHYTKHRQQAEEMSKRTFLPYRQALLSCLGFSVFHEKYSYRSASTSYHGGRPYNVHHQCARSSHI